MWDVLCWGAALLQVRLELFFFPPSLGLSCFLLLQAFFHLSRLQVTPQFVNSYLDDCIFPFRQFPPLPSVSPSSLSRVVPFFLIGNARWEFFSLFFPLQNYTACFLRMGLAPFSVFSVFFSPFPQLGEAATHLLSFSAPLSHCGLICAGLNCFFFYPFASSSAICLSFSVGLTLTSHSFLKGRFNEFIPPFVNFSRPISGFPLLSFLIFFADESFFHLNVLQCCLPGGIPLGTPFFLPPRSPLSFCSLKIWL